MFMVRINNEKSEKETKQIMKKKQNKSYKLFCLKVNGSSSNWSLWRLTPQHRHHLNMVQLANYLAK